jgi:Cu-processing system permease protein
LTASPGSKPCASGPGFIESFRIDGADVLTRISAIALNTYREAVRARLLLGILALGVAMCLYSVVAAAQSLHQELRVVADVGAAALSLCAVVAAVVLGSTSLYRELELKTIFPILSRPIRRWEYLLGKYLGTILTVSVFIAIEAATVFSLLALEAGQRPWKVASVAIALFAALGVALVRARHLRVFLVVPWTVVCACAFWVLAAPAFEERQVVTASAILSVFEIGIVTAAATLFSSFSSPFLTSACTAMVFLIGRSSDTMAHIPKGVFGAGCSAAGRVGAHVIPNLHTYVPPRPLLLGETAEPIWRYVATAGVQAVAYSAILLIVAIFAFNRRDFS